MIRCGGVGEHVALRKLWIFSLETDPENVNMLASESVLSESMTAPAREGSLN